MKPEFTIRRMKRSDIEECIPIFIEGNKVYGETFSNALARKYLNNSFRWSRIRLYAVIDCRIAGFVMASKSTWPRGEHCFIENIFVSRKHHGKNIGTALIKQVEKEARRLGMARMKLASRKGSNAFRFYEKNGFRPTGWVYMEKRLKH